MSETFVVIGGGLAAGKAVEELRTAGFGGDVILFAAEPHPPYERPPLSKGFLLGKAELDSVFVHPPQWYDEHRVEVRAGEAVTRLDPSAHVVESAGGSTRYDRLLLATGARPRPLPFDTAGVPVAYLRTIEDSRRLKNELTPGRRIVLIGGGWIGLEVAAAASEAGAEVTVIVPGALPLQAVLGPEVASVFADLHRGHGVNLRTAVRAVGVDTAGVVLSDGQVVAADLVIVGTGVIPETGLAEEAGLDVDNGVLLDTALATSNPDVFAAGDIANAMHPLLGRRIRVEHWDTAIGQGRAAARNMLGAGLAYERLPYFFTDQYDLGMEYVGYVGPDGYTEVIIRGDTDGLNFTAWWLAGTRVLAGMHVNDWDATDEIRRIVGRQVDLDALRNPATPLSELAPA